MGSHTLAAEAIVGQPYLRPAHFSCEIWDFFSKVERNDYTGNITVFHLKLQGDNDHISGFQYPHSAHL